MAIVTLPGGTQMSGKLGGWVYSHNRGGPYIRNRAIPTNPGTQRQVDARNRVKNLAIAWTITLTQAQRDAWELYAANTPWTNRLGQAITLTGLDMFVRSNSVILQAGLAQVNAAPIVFTLAAAEAALVGSASAAAQTLSIAYDDTPLWCDEDEAAEVFYMGRPQNPGVKFFKGPYRHIGSVEGDSIAPPATPYAGVAAAWPIAEGQRIWIRSRIFRADGRLSPLAEHNFLCAA